MKFIVYKDQKKITVDNVTIPNQLLIDELTDLDSSKELTLDDPQLYKLRITGAQSIIDEDAFDEEIIPTIDGINWHQETVN